MNIISGVCLILGCFLGAGFVSGREIACYFSQYGNFAYISIVIAVGLFFTLVMFFFMLSKDTCSVGNFSKSYFGKFSGFANFMLMLSVLIVSSSMLAGTLSLAECLNINKYVFVTITIVLTYFIVIGNVKMMSKINSIVVPVLIAIVAIVSTINIGQGEVCVNAFQSIFSGINYMFINIVSLGMFLLEIGCRYTRKEKVLISIISSVIVGVLLVLATTAISSNNMVSEIMPMLKLAECNKVLFFVTQISIYFGLFTTLISNVFLLGNYVNSHVGNYKLSVAISIALSYILSLCGFDIIVGFVYSIIGVFGIALVISVCIKEHRNKKSRLKI